jgi:hypothetical protein
MTGDADHCPFRRGKGKDLTYHDCGPSVGSCCEIVIENLKTGRRIEFSSLTPHLIRDHHFFLGGVQDRISPETFCEVLECPLPKPQTFTENYWKLNFTSDEVNDDFLDHALAHCSAKGYLDPAKAAYYFVQTMEDLLKEVEDRARVILEDETDEYYIGSINAQLESKRNELKSKPDARRLILLVNDNPVFNFEEVEGAMLRVADWSHSIYHFTAAKRNSCKWDTCNEENITK